MSKILVIDDSVLMRKMSRNHLEEAGFEVEDFLPDSMADLTERIRHSLPDLVLSDFNMPSMDGLNVARTVKRTNPSIPIIILTANRDASREALLQTIGVRMILHKPIHGSDLVGAVSKVLSKGN